MHGYVTSARDVGIRQCCVCVHYANDKSSVLIVKQGILGHTAF